MFPKTALRILLLAAFFLVVFLLALYKVRFEYNSAALKKIEHQVEMDKKVLELGELLDKIPILGDPESESGALIRQDLEKNGSVQPETVQKIIDISNRLNRLKNGLPVN